MTAPTPLPHACQAAEITESLLCPCTGNGAQPAESGTPSPMTAACSLPLTGAKEVPTRERP